MVASQHRIVVRAHSAKGADDIIWQKGAVRTAVKAVAPLPLPQEWRQESQGAQHHAGACTSALLHCTLRIVLSVWYCAIEAGFKVLQCWCFQRAQRSARHSRYPAGMNQLMPSPLKLLYAVCARAERDQAALRRCMTRW